MGCAATQADSSSYRIVSYRISYRMLLFVGDVPSFPTTSLSPSFPTTFLSPSSYEELARRREYDRVSVEAARFCFFVGAASALLFVVASWVSNLSCSQAGAFRLFFLKASLPALGRTEEPVSCSCDSSSRTKHQTLP